MENKFLPFSLTVASVVLLVVLGLFSNNLMTGYLIFFADSADPDVVLNLTFDDTDDPWKDYSSYDHDINDYQVSWVSKDFCKWYGCINLSQTDGSDFLNGTFDLGFADMAMSFWLYVDSRPSGSSPQAYYWLDQNQRKWSNEGAYGLNTEFEEVGSFSTSTGSSQATLAKQWTHYFLQYDGSRFMIWKNGELLKNESTDDIAFLIESEDMFQIGKGAFGIDTHGYMDEFILWRKANFTHNQVVGRYESQKLGTPPDRDLYVEHIEYRLPVDWNDAHNTLSVESIPINITISNAGIENIQDAAYRIVVNNSELCSGLVDVNATSSVNVSCDWSGVKGFYTGLVEVDQSNSIAEDDESNNVQTLYLPYLDRPWMHFTLDEWNTTIKPHCDDNENGIAYSSCNFFKSFVSEDFNAGWNGNDVDPRAKKGRENAMGCLYNGYDRSSTQCIRALNHLQGWAAADLDSYDNVQAIHEVVHVGMLYDWLFPMLTPEENQQVVGQLYEICQHITNLDNVRPDRDVDSNIIADNGKGFGSGMAALCYSLIGAYPANPTLIQDIEDQYSASSLVDEWMDREVSYMRAFKNDGWAGYQEHWLYTFYSQFHLVESFLFQKRYGLSELDEFNEGLCSMGRSFAYKLLDHTYDGNDLRNDEGNMFRGIQAGDSNSYEDPGSDSLLSWSIANYYGLLCDDLTTKQAMLFLRDKAYEVGDASRSVPDMYTYGQLDTAVAAVSPDVTFPRIIFDQANDILTVRDNYTYVDDTVFMLDGGEERGAGHSQAQGYYLYVMGEPFLDFEQVPYEDDVRSETWKNGISLQDATQTQEGLGGEYSDDCGNAPKNQYYGMGDCPYGTTDQYPDYRVFPLEYGGDIEDYVGSADAYVAGAYAWRPYQNADAVKEYFILIDNYLFKRTKVSGNTQDQGVYHNFINIYDEFSESRDGTDITWSRDSKNLRVSILQSNASWSIGGGDSGVRYCFSKTSCSGGFGGDGNYRRTYYYSPQDDVDFTMMHQWYTTSASSYVYDNDMITVDEHKISFTGTLDDYTTDGWGLVVSDDVIAAFNATYVQLDGVDLIRTAQPISFVLNTSSINHTLNIATYERSVGLDVAADVIVNLSLGGLSNNAFVAVSKSGGVQGILGYDNNVLSMQMSSGQYGIVGTQEDNASPQVNLTLSAQDVSLRVNVTSNEYVNASVTVNNGSWISEASQSVLNAVHSFFFSSLSPNSTYYVSVQVCDVAGNCNTTQDNVSTLPLQPNTTYPSSLLSFATGYDWIQFSGVWSEQVNATVTIGNQTRQQTSNSLFYRFVNQNESTQYVINVTWCTFDGRCVVNLSNVTTTSAQPNLSGFNGNTTVVFIDRSRVENFTLEQSGVAKIQFNQTINVTGRNFAEYVVFGDRFVYFDSSVLDINTTAQLVFYNVSLDNPVVYRDGSLCNDCTLTIENDTIVVGVPHFTNYSLQEVPDEPEDSGGSSGGSGGSSGSSGGSGGSSGSRSGGLGSSVTIVPDVEQPDIEQPELNFTQGDEQEVEQIVVQQELPEQQPQIQQPLVSQTIRDELQQPMKLALQGMFVLLVSFLLGILVFDGAKHYILRDDDE